MRHLCGGHRGVGSEGPAARSAPGRPFWPGPPGAPIYGSGGFTTYDDATTRAQLNSGPVGLPRVKIKIGESWGGNPGRDLSRVALAREVVGDDVELYVDANGGYTRKQAVRMGQQFYDDHRLSG